MGGWVGGKRGGGGVAAAKKKKERETDDWLFQWIFNVPNVLSVPSFSFNGGIRQQKEKKKKKKKKGKPFLVTGRRARSLLAPVKGRQRN